MPGELFVRVNGGYKRVPHDEDGHLDGHGFFVRVNGSWKRVQEGYVRVNGGWEIFYGPGDVEPPPDPPTPGNHILNASAIWLPSDGSNGYAEFNTADYRGYITEIRATVTWKSPVLTQATFGVSGRPNGNFYRDIIASFDWGGRTIDHRIDSFDATSLTDFNSGAAIGFNFNPSGVGLGQYWTNVKLTLTTA